MGKVISWNYDRRWGVELELNSLDGQNRPKEGQHPAGIKEVMLLVWKGIGQDGKCDIRGYEHTNNNDGWVLKMDSSCGMEVCTPVMKGWSGLEKLCRVSQVFRNTPEIARVDKRCSVHVHVDISDLITERGEITNEFGSVIQHWIKTELVFLDSLPDCRKRNRYCPTVSLRSLFQHDQRITASDLVRKIGQSKYHSFNTNQFVRNGRKTVEFRVIEGEGVINPFLLKNWVRLVVHFVERAMLRPYLEPYRPNDATTSFLIMDPFDTFTLLGFNPETATEELSPGLKQVRNWFLARLLYGAEKTWSRARPFKEIQALCDMVRQADGVEINEDWLYPQNIEEALYDKNLKV